MLYVGRPSPIVLTCLALVACALASASPRNPADELMRKAVDAMHLKREEAVYSMVLSGPGGEQGTRRMRVWFKSQGQDDAKLRIRLTEPADIRGTGFLTLLGEGGRSKEQWLYLPAYHKVRRIGGGNETEPFLDSDFTLEDVSIERKGRFAYQVTGEARCGQAQCFVLTGRPVGGTHASYSKKIVFIRKDTYLNVRTEFYDGAGALEKILTLEKYHRDAASGRWMPDELKMTNLLARHATRLQIEKRVAGDPADSLFTQRALEDGS
jgi:hypothetical protein